MSEVTNTDLVMVRYFIAEKGDERYYWPDGSVRWGYPVNVRHLIVQLETMDPEMKVSSVMNIHAPNGTKARAYGLSMSLERWGEDGWLDYKLPIPHCLAIWAYDKPDSGPPKGDKCEVQP